MVDGHICDVFNSYDGIQFFQECDVANSLHNAQTSKIKVVIHSITIMSIIVVVL